MRDSVTLDGVKRIPSGSFPSAQSGVGGAPRAAPEEAPAPRIEPAMEAAEVVLEDDSYLKHEPHRTKVEQFVTRQLDKVAPIRTHERVMTEVKGSLFGLEVGITVSQLDLVKKNTHGLELVQVVNQDGSANVESILARKHLGVGHRVELQGPALNSSVTPGELPLGARFLGVGLTTDVTSAMDHDAASYTVEVKISEKSLLEWAALGGPGAAQVAADALTGAVETGAAAVIADLVVGAVPVLSAALAVASARRAIHVVRDPTAKKAMKWFAVLHAVGDAVRVFFPIAGTLANAALVGVAATQGWIHHRHAKHAPPTGPPDATLATTSPTAPKEDALPSPDEKAP
jgi:hypothetical protein